MARKITVSIMLDESVYTAARIYAKNLEYPQTFGAWVRYLIMEGLAKKANGKK
jgi:hypothetical protein